MKRNMTVSMYCIERFNPSTSICLFHEIAVPVTTLREYMRCAELAVLHVLVSRARAHTQRASVVHVHVQIKAFNLHSGHHLWYEVN